MRNYLTIDMFVGTLGCTWFVMWLFYVYNSPSEHPRISYSEQRYIELSIGHNEEQVGKNFVSFSVGQSVHPSFHQSVGNHGGF